LGTTSELGEPHGNRMRTHWRTREKNKNNLPLPSAKQKKKLNPLSAFSLTA